MTTFMVNFRCVPLEGTDHYYKFSKAIFFVWVVDQKQVNAEKRAIAYVQKAGWKIIICEGVHIFTKESAAKHPDNLRSFQMVQRTGLLGECITSPAGDAPRFN